MTIRTSLCLVTVAIALTSPLHSVTALAHDASRISRLESELQQLRIRIDEQNRRIERLEAELRRQSGQQVPLSPPQPMRRRDAQPSPGRSEAEPAPWHSIDAWDRIEKGMTEPEVIAILGSPTSVESLEAFRTLFYRRAAEDGAQLAGHVNLREGRVVAVRPPHR